MDLLSDLQDMLSFYDGNLQDFHQTELCEEEQTTPTSPQRKRVKRSYESATELNPEQSMEEQKREMQQRKTASDRERSRMKDMNSAFEMLRNKLAHRKQPGKKMPKIQALRYAIEYISDLEETLTMATNMPNGGNAYFQWARARGFIWAREKAKLPEFQNMPTDDVPITAEYDDHSSDLDTCTVPVQPNIDSHDLQLYQTKFGDEYHSDEITITHL